MVSTFSSLYRKVSTFFRYTTIHWQAQKCGYFTSTFSSLYRKVSTFLDIRQFIGKPRNVDTLLYREVSSFLDIRQFMEKPRNVDTLLYREVSTFFHGKPSHCHISKECGNLPIKYPHFWAFP